MKKQFIKKYGEELIVTNKEDIFELCIRHFGTYLYSQKRNNPLYVPTEKDILTAIKQADALFQLSLSNEDLNIISTRIKAVYSIYQEEGSVILGDYEHDYEWYNTLKQQNNFEEFYWNRYKSYLSNKLFGNVIDTLDKDTTKITSYLGNPREEGTAFSIRGLVVGDVQSGKTSNYLGLITKAADAGYKVIFILTGTIESLRKQTQIRIEEGFIGYDSINGEDVGVGRGTKTPKAFTSRDKDFRITNSQNTTYKINEFSNEPMVFVVKKNVSVLKTIYNSFKKINTTTQYEKINSSLLLIDDEADNASINTNKEDNDPTKINKYIRKILSLFIRNSYVGYTATPFANVFIRYESQNEMLKDDLFPRDFIYSLCTPSNYLGPNKYFAEKNENVKFIKDKDEHLFPSDNSQKTWDGDKLFPSFYHAINTFLISNAIRDIKEDGNNKTHRSMLINISRFIKVQIKISSIVNDYLDLVKSNIKLTHKLSLEESMKNPTVKSLFETFNEEYSNLDIQWKDVFSRLYDSIKDIKIIVVNSNQKKDKLNYEKQQNGLRVIAIGGLALSRGLTLEGLCVSYFYRNTKTFDVLMQMGRWFGYRDKYANLCRIFMLEESAGYYKYILDSINLLKADIRKMGKQHKKPEEYGIRVLNESTDLHITAANKSRNTSQRSVRKSYFGNIFETPYLHRNLDIIKLNISSTLDFMSKLSLNDKDTSIKHPYFRNVSKELVIELLSKLKIHNANENFDTTQMIRFLNNNYKELSKFDVLIIGGSSNSTFTYKDLNINIPLVRRKYDINGNEIIRISGQRAHIFGRADTKNGLSIEQKELIGNNLRAQDCLIEGRNPLLIIYFVEPDNSQESDDINHLVLKDDTSLLQDLQSKNMKYLIGYAIGFPANAKYNSRDIQYTVNKTVDYFDKDHEDQEDIGDDGNE